MNWSYLLIFLGVACFVLDALGIEARIKWFPLGWAFVVAGALLV